MFGNCLIEMAARAAGFTPAQLAVIERDMPATRKLIDLIIQAQPLIQKAAPLVDKAMPLIKELMPLLDKALPLIKEVEPIADQAMPLIKQAVPLGDQISKEVSAIAPTLQIIMAVVQRDLAQGASPKQSFTGVLKKIQGALGGLAPMPPDRW
jgi:hypothetical protein